MDTASVCFKMCAFFWRNSSASSCDCSSMVSRSNLSCRCNRRTLFLTCSVEVDSPRLQHRGAISYSSVSLRANLTRLHGIDESSIELTLLFAERIGKAEDPSSGASMVCAFDCCSRFAQHLNCGNVMCKRECEILRSIILQFIRYGSHELLKMSNRCWGSRVVGTMKIIEWVTRR